MKANGNQREEREHKQKVGSTTLTRRFCTQQVARVISLLGCEFMVHSFDYSLAWVFPRLTVVSFLPYHFLDNHDVMGFILG